MSSKCQLLSQCLLVYSKSLQCRCFLISWACIQPTGHDIICMVGLTVTIVAYFVWYRYIQRVNIILFAYKKKHINLKSLNVVLHLDRSVSFRVMWLTLTCQTTHFKECFLKDVIESSSCKVLMMNSNLLFTGNLKDMCSKNKKRIKLNCAILLLVCKNLPLICEESKNKLRKYYMGKDMISTNLDVTVSYLAWF